MKKNSDKNLNIYFVDNKLSFKFKALFQNQNFLNNGDFGRKKLILLI